MWKDPLPPDLEGEAGKAVCERVERLRSLGCGLLRFAVPDMETADVLGRLASRVSIPLCADIHFDYRIALRCLDWPVAKLRINPGNIGTRKKVEAVVEKAAAKAVPLRIGVNAGSLPAALRGSRDRAGALVQAAVDELALFNELGFTNTIVSMKASGIADTIKANTLFGERSDVPLHIGVTEAGPLVAGTVKNTAALVPLLSSGIGDTVRVSLSDSMENEVAAAREIINAAAELPGNPRLSKRGVTIVSCPRCGRAGFDTHSFIARWQSRLDLIEKRLTIGIMGCAVNGPGEASHADLGITGAGNKVLLFARGSVIRTIETEDADSAFEAALRNLLEDP
jgi:(E)-4-hydroxy-3-methylbut-2-enyl-diphosphate synthase